MKKMIISLSAVFLLLALCACGAAEAYPIDYGRSEIYSQAEMDSAIALIMKEFSTWTGCEMHSIRYAGDEANSEENIRWMNMLEEGENFTQCIEFISDFHSPVNGGGAWNPDDEYYDWQWWLARTEGGEWQLMTSGY